MARNARNNRRGERVKESLRTGLGFGLTSAALTTMGLMVGLSASTHSRSAVIAGILTIAIADTFADALGIHISEDAKNKRESHVWTATIATLFSKGAVALSFLVPFLVLTVDEAVSLGMAWGFLLIALVSHRIAQAQGESTVKVAGEHILLGIGVILATHYAGTWISANV